MHQWRILSKLKISKIDLSILVILIRNCLALTYPVEKMGKCFSRGKGLLNFRAEHAGLVFFDEEKFTREAWRLFKFLHGEETKEHPERLTAGRLRQVYFVAFLLFSS